MKIKEGGNAFKDGMGVSTVTTIKQDDLLPTLEYISKVVGLPMHSEINDNGIITRYGIEDSLLGSAGKAQDGSFGKKTVMGDIDIAIDEERYTFDELLSKLVQKLGGENVSKPMKGMGVIPTRIPIAGDENNGFVQVDFMLGNVKLLTFTYGAPDVRYGTSKYSGAYKNILMTGILQNMRRQVRDPETQEILALVGPSLLLNKGVVSQWRHFPMRKDGTGRLKTMKAISRDEFNKEYPTNTGTEEELSIVGPDDIVKFIFPESKLKASDLNSFEDIRDAVIKYIPDQAENIFNRFIATLQNRKMDIPDGLVMESLAMLEVQRTLTEVRSHSMSMVSESLVTLKTFDTFRNSCCSLLDHHKKSDHYTKPKATADMLPQDGYYYLINKCGMEKDWDTVCGDSHSCSCDEHVENLQYFFKELLDLIHSVDFFYVADHYKLKVTPESFINGLIDLEPIDKVKY